MGSGHPPEGNRFVLGAGSVWRFQRLSGPSHARRCTHARRFVAIETTRSHPAQTYKQQSSLDFRVPAGTDVMGPSESAGLLAQTV